MKPETMNSAAPIGAETYGKITGGPAFPTGDNPESRLRADPGMTLRDYFATEALPIAAGMYPRGHNDGWIGIANVAYKIADAMLAERAK